MKSSLAGQPSGVTQTSPAAEGIAGGQRDWGEITDKVEAAGGLWPLCRKLNYLQYMVTLLSLVPLAVRRCGKFHHDNYYSYYSDAVPNTCVIHSELTETMFCVQ